MFALNCGQFLVRACWRFPHNNISVVKGNHVTTPQSAPKRLHYVRGGRAGRRPWCHQWGTDYECDSKQSGASWHNCEQQEEIGIYFSGETVVCSGPQANFLNAAAVACWSGHGQRLLWVWLRSRFHKEKRTGAAVVPQAGGDQRRRSFPPSDAKLKSENFFFFFKRFLR